MTNTALPDFQNMTRSECQCRIERMVADQVQSFSTSELVDYVYYDLVTFFTKQATTEDLEQLWDDLYGRPTAR